MFYGLSDSTPYTGPTYGATSPYGFNVPGDPNNPASAYGHPGSCAAGETLRNVGGDNPVCLSADEWAAFNQPQSNQPTWLWLGVVGLFMFAVLFRK